MKRFLGFLDGSYGIGLGVATVLLAWGLAWLLGRGPRGEGRRRPRNGKDGRDGLL